MTTKTVNLYTFDELSDKAKDKAREWYRRGEAEDFGAHGELNEPIEEAAKLLGITFRTHEVKLMGGSTRTEPNIYWQLDGQGCGANFQGYYSFVRGSLKSIKAEYPTDEKLHAIARELAQYQKSFKYGLTADITTSGNSSHEYAMDVEPCDRNGNRVDCDIVETFRDFARWIHDYIREEYDSRMSDENVDDSIRINEYTFLESGKREN